MTVEEKLKWLKVNHPTHEEIETHINWERGSKYAYVYTDEIRIAKKLLKDNRFEYIHDPQSIGFEFKVDKKVVARPVVR